MTIDSTQKGVARGMATAVAFAIGVFAIAYVLQWPSFSQVSVDSRLKLAALAALAPAAVLFVCIARLAKHRFTTPQDIHGSALTEGTDRAKLLQALLQNTLEQTVLAVPVYLAAATVFPASISVATLATAIAVWQPNVWNVARSITFLPPSSLNFTHIRSMSPQSALPTVPTESAFSISPRFFGLAMASWMRC